jgi:hypothetical protein
MAKKLLRLTLISAMALLGLLPAPGALGGTIITRHRIDDLFNGSSIDPNKWIVRNNDPANVSLVEGGGVLSISASANASEHFDGDVLSRCFASGNFDEQVSFSLPVWAEANSVTAVMDAMYGYGAGRISSPDFDAYFSFLDPQFVDVPTTDRHGTMRIVRRGSSMTAYYRQAGQWVMLDTNTNVPTVDTQMDLRLFAPNGPFGGQPVQVDYDNFHLYAHRIRC